MENRPDELDLDDEDWEDDPPPRRAGITMRHPLLLVLVLVGSVFMLVETWPRAEYILQAGDPADCGDISARPGLRQRAPDELPELKHDTFCELTGVVQSLAILATGEPKEVGDVYARQAGRKYYVKLDGDKVFAVLAADRKDVVDYRARKGSLFGYEVNGTGRMIDPQQDPGFTATARTLRLKFSIPDDTMLRIFDTTEEPTDRWPFAAICALMAFTALLAAFGLLRIVRARMAER